MNRSESINELATALAKAMQAYPASSPLLWMLYQRGYAISSLRKRETEMERQIRELRERLEREELKNRVLVEALNGRAA